MESKAVTQERAKVAFQVSMLMLQPTFNKRLADIDFRNEDGGIPMVVAGAEESAVVTLHRMETSGDENVLLASMAEGRVRVCALGKRNGTRSSSSAVELLGGTTVWDWMGMLVDEQSQAQFFYSNGSDIMTTSSALEYAV